MSANSSNNTIKYVPTLKKATKAHGKKTPPLLPDGDAEKPKVVKRNWWALLVLPAWVLAAFFNAQVVMLGVLSAIAAAGITLESYATTNVLETITSTLVYVVAFLLTFGIPYLFKKSRYITFFWGVLSLFGVNYLLSNFFHIPVQEMVGWGVLPTIAAIGLYTLMTVAIISLPYWIDRSNVTLAQLGLQRLPSWNDIGLAPLGFIVYGLITAGILYVAVTYIPAFPADQVQETGFKGLTNRYEMLLAFLTLVVIAPIAEEALFRGYLFGRLKERVPLIPAMIVVSILFGALHGQWNVALDTFALSMVMCSLRVVTGSIWAGILLHMIKNGIAFYLLFINPLIAPTIGG